MFLMCESLRFAYVVVTTRTDSAITGPITCSFSSVVVSAAVDVVVSGGAAIAAPRAGGCCSTSGSAASSPRSSTTEERMSSVVGTSSVDVAMAVRVVEWLQLYVCGYSMGTAVGPPV